MANVSEWVKIEGDAVQASLQQAHDKVSHAQGGVVLDFSSLRRMDTTVVSALEALLVSADENGVKLALRGVNIEAYKVLKLSRLSSRFSFVS